MINPHSTSKPQLRACAPHNHFMPCACDCELNKALLSTSRPGDAALLYGTAQRDVPGLTRAAVPVLVNPGWQIGLKVGCGNACLQSRQPGPADPTVCKQVQQGADAAGGSGGWSSFSCWHPTHSAQARSALHRASPWASTAAPRRRPYRGAAPFCGAMRPVGRRSSPCGTPAATRDAPSTTATSACRWDLRRAALEDTLCRMLRWRSHTSEVCCANS